MPSKRKNKTTKRNKHMRNKKSKTVRKFRKITGGHMADYYAEHNTLYEEEARKKAEEEEKNAKRKKLIESYE